MTKPRHHVVYDCVVFAQALINPDGPSGLCVEKARDGTVQLFVSEYTIHEIRGLDGKLPDKYQVTSRQINDLADEVSLLAVFVSVVPSVYHHPHDPADSPYVDLAIATDSNLIVSRDRHLLNLMDGDRPEGKDFIRRFPRLRVIAPDVFAEQLRVEEQQFKS